MQTLIVKSILIKELKNKAYTVPIVLILFTRKTSFECIKATYKTCKLTVLILKNRKLICLVLNVLFSQ